MVLTQHLKHQNRLSVLIFGKEVYLDIEVISLLSMNTAILAHEDEEREKNRFERDDHRQ